MIGMTIFYGLIFWFPSNESDSEEEEVSQSSVIKQSWIKRKQLFENDFALTSWAHSLEIRDDVRLNLDGDKRMAIKRVIVKLHNAPNPNSKVVND